MRGAQHTPGPWRVEQDTTLIWGVCDPADNSTRGMGYPIVDVRLVTSKWSESGWRSVRVEEEAVANARLIAAAPDLLAALKDCAESLAFAREKLGMSGEGDGKDRRADAPDDISSLPALQSARAAIAKAEGRT